MIASMTGYGRGVAKSDVGTMTAEIKSVNSRFLELSVRTDLSASLEQAARNILKERLGRGKVNLSLTFAPEAGKRTYSAQVNRPLLSAYESAFAKLAADKHLKIKKLKPRDLLFLPVSVFDVTEIGADEDALLSLAETAVTEAVLALVAMRREEGAHLAEDLSARLDFLSEKIAGLKVSQESVQARYETRLRERMQKLLADMNAEIDETRLLQEVAVYSEKTDYTEEIVRFESHIAQFRDILREGGEVGRKLDFLLQELNREVNTLGSKAGETDAINDVIILKTELEKIREQVQNLE